MNKLRAIALPVIPSLPGAQEIVGEIVRDCTACFGTCKSSARSN